jgi:Uncharacterized protein conserved in bacteria
MKTYIALLRGINVGGKNKISMPELRKGFNDIGFFDVSTYINSGNVVFSSDIENKSELINKVESMIYKQFELNIPVTVLSAVELANIFINAPEWWNTSNKEIYDNTVFVIPPMTVAEVCSAVGEAIADHEKLGYYDSVIFWSANLKNFSKSRWSKIASLPINNNVTIRNANTVKKLVEIANKSIEK